LNGCELALQYQEPREGGPIGPPQRAVGEWDCSYWAKFPCEAKKHHIDLDLVQFIECRGRRFGAQPGTCNFETACVSMDNRGLHDYQDCNNDPRDGCEDTSQWCQVGLAEFNGPRATLSDKCSKASVYDCDIRGFDSNNAPCSDPATGLFLDFPAPFRSAKDCWDMITNNASHKVNTTVLKPYCDRDPTNLDTRGDCVFICQTNYEDCDGLATNGCEKDIRLDGSCDNLCIDCLRLSGIDRSTNPKCIVDPLREGHYKCNFTCSPGILDCKDADLRWENGCELTANSDTDETGVFVNEGEPQDCSVMQIEARKNPELFRHHLHIDLTKPVKTIVPGADLPAGTIFCNNGFADVALSGAYNGNCFFMCIDGFTNTNHKGYDGCEGKSGSFNTQYVTLDPTSPLPYVFGGYLIGDPHVEEYLNFLESVYTDPTYTDFITFQQNVEDFNERVNSDEFAITSSTGTYALNYPIWY
jgi:hypothetical protein